MKKISDENKYYLNRGITTFIFSLCLIFAINFVSDILVKMSIKGNVDTGEKLIYFILSEACIFFLIIIFSVLDIFNKFFGIGYRGETLDVRLKKKIRLKSLQNRLEGEDDK